MSNEKENNPVQKKQKIKNITIADVAKAAGVSLGTVSRVINSKDGIIKVSENTTQKVLEAAKTLGYKPNPFAAALRSQKSGIIGIIVRDINDPFLRQIIRDVQCEAHKKGVELLIGHAEYEMKTAERQLSFMVNHWFDGLVLLGNLPGDEKVIHSLQNRNTPMVSIASGYDMDLPFIDFDNVYGARVALEYLSGLGHKRIAFIGNQQHAGVKQRLDEYRAFLSENSLVLDDRYIYPDTRMRGEAREYTRCLLKLPKPPTAIFCASDYFALSAISSAWQMGMQIPKDISIMGYDDIEELTDVFVPLTTIKQSTSDIGKYAIELLQKMIDRSNDYNEKTELKPELIIRNSCSEP